MIAYGIITISWYCNAESGYVWVNWNQNNATQSHIYQIIVRKHTHVRGQKSSSSIDRVNSSNSIRCPSIEDPSKKMAQTASLLGTLALG